LEIFTANPFFAYLFIFFARVCDVSLGVFRLLLITRGYAVPAAVIGFFEVSIFVVALGTAISGGITDYVKVIAYALGFATGNLVGIKIEEKMALGYVVVQVFPARECCDHLAEILRSNNYGVTAISGEGKWGPREILLVTAKRKDLGMIMKILNETSPEVFFNVSDVRSIHGGVFPRKKPGG